MKKSDPFTIEELRQKYALTGNRSKFLATYSAQSPGIVDHNTPASWEKLLGDIPDIQDPMTADRIAITAQMMRPITQKTTGLDIGIGNGWVEKRVDRKYPGQFVWTGIDITKDNLTSLKHELQGDMHRGDVLNMPRAVMKRQFNYVLLLEVLEHIPHTHTHAVLKTIHTLIADNGYFIISVPINENLKEKIARGTNHSHHVRRYTPEIIRMELSCAGFEVVEAHELYAFSSWYRFKSLIARITKRWKPNVIVIKARKRS